MAVSLDGHNRRSPPAFSPLSNAGVDPVRTTAKLVAVEFEGDERGIDGEVAMAFIVIVIGTGRAVGHMSHPGNRTCGEQERLHEARFPGPLVAGEGHISDLFGGVFVHGKSPFLLSTCANWVGTQKRGH